MFQPDLLKGKRVLITGGGTGLGKSMWRRMIELGAELMICGRRAQVLEDTAKEFEASLPCKVRTHVVDIRSPGLVGRLVSRQLILESVLDTIRRGARKLRD